MLEIPKFAFFARAGKIGLVAVHLHREGTLHGFANHLGAEIEGVDAGRIDSLPPSSKQRTISGDVRHLDVDFPEAQGRKHHENPKVFGLQATQLMERIDVHTAVEGH